MSLVERPSNLLLEGGSPRFTNRPVSAVGEQEQREGDMTILERTSLARDFLQKSLTSRERMLVAALVLGFSQAEVARAWQVSSPSVSKMAKGIRVKAELYWR
jgi:DNA-binding NarL/FixJ family response regulator